MVPGLAFLSDVFFPNESVTAPLQMWGVCRFSPNWEGRGPTGWQRLSPSGPHQAGQHLRSGGGRKPEAPHWCWRATAQAPGPAQKVLLQGVPFRPNSCSTRCTLGPRQPCDPQAPHYLHLLSGVTTLGVCLPGGRKLHWLVGRKTHG